MSTCPANLLREMCWVQTRDYLAPMLNEFGVRDFWRAGTNDEIVAVRLDNRYGYCRVDPDVFPSTGYQWALETATAVAWFDEPYL